MTWFFDSLKERASPFPTDTLFLNIFETLKFNRGLVGWNANLKDGCLHQPAPGGIINTMMKIWRFT